ncbi:hypothetical protein NCER_101706 [Vairimorpha ceranae BRL01]|uniref:Uncharacterized protein n=2 Tax=Vairimorpha ceranae TaxID=40302 RepID=C4VAL1_VAIC1|nr:hypothetical protein AAJ76_1730002198 [Vairimorpha ceranae]EEQ81741.1 hypothetical protein NCER_101706 [Vairimorpha ceranae BRL01]KKO73921.1 hypothetical protein AAJ76_1730002198 [Vairimorpha ceranae]
MQFYHVILFYTNYLVYIEEVYFFSYFLEFYSKLNTSNLWIRIYFFFEQDISLLLSNEGLLEPDFLSHCPVSLFFFETVDWLIKNFFEISFCLQPISKKALISDFSLNNFCVIRDKNKAFYSFKLNFPAKKTFHFFAT